MDENTAPIVKRVFDEYANGRGFTEIAGALMEEDVLRPGKGQSMVSGDDQGNPYKQGIYWRVYLRKDKTGDA